MTASEFASLLHARRTGKGRWIAKCPAHPDKTPSLAIVVGKKVPVLIKCMSQGCDTRAVLEAMGLRWADLFAGEASAELRGKLALEERRRELLQQLGLVMVLRPIEKERRAYWSAAEKRIRSELVHLACSLDPEKVVRGYRNKAFREKVRKVGWDRIWNEFLASSEGKAAEREYGRQHGIHTTAAGVQEDSGRARPDRVHHRPPQLSDGGIRVWQEEGLRSREHVARGL